MEVVAVDIGGTHARFAVAEVAEGRVVSISEPMTQKVTEHPSLQLAWQAFGKAEKSMLALGPMWRSDSCVIATPLGTSPGSGLPDMASSLPSDVIFTVSSA